MGFVILVLVGKEIGLLDVCNVMECVMVELIRVFGYLSWDKNNLRWSYFLEK